RTLLPRFRTTKTHSCPRRSPPIAMQQCDAMRAESWYPSGPLPLQGRAKMRRRKLVTLIGGLAIAWPLASYAQQPKQSLKRVGVLAFLTPCPLQPDNIGVRRLAERGWIEGRNFVFDCVSTVWPRGSSSGTRPRAGIAASRCFDHRSLGICKCAKAGNDDHPYRHA